MTPSHAMTKHAHKFTYCTYLLTPELHGTQSQPTVKQYRPPVHLPVDQVQVADRHSEKHSSTHMTNIIQQDNHYNLQQHNAPPKVHGSCNQI